MDEITEIDYICLETQLALTEANTNGRETILTWIPGHCSIPASLLPGCEKSLYPLFVLSHTNSLHTNICGNGHEPDNTQTYLMPLCH
ncbi:unnamed protein product [Callosobruchus maculatus]|uniref:Uncharacterized protein n=1 Tax=Callosobruchus maculatus TaxID=64391 RepID=A0A653BMQ9_CALMS|nr:unnamed protein product [Callosobruchus maculatus]